MKCPNCGSDVKIKEEMSLVGLLTYVNCTKCGYKRKFRTDELGLIHDDTMYTW